MVENIVDPDIVRGQNDIIPAGLHQYILRIEGMSRTGEYFYPGNELFVVAVDEGYLAARFRSTISRTSFGEKPPLSPLLPFCQAAPTK
jgi:hypothetical protein